MVQYYLETMWRRLGEIGINSRYPYHLFRHVSITSALYKGMNNIRTEEDHSGKQFYLLTRLILTHEHFDSPIMEQYFTNLYRII